MILGHYGIGGGKVNIEVVKAGFFALTVRDFTQAVVIALQLPINSGVPLIVIT